ncbi:MAG TPA: Gfo/Idh/MocA family oxidoreductase [Chloroflexota bacterium]|jgi:predicted dehydrogenase|nr:Gfo/Idh/MocA family oxidoreductase [Chloroflexota bacterium]
MDEIRIAVVGLGSRGSGTWLSLLQQMEGYRVTAICDPIAALHERAVARLKRPQEVKVYRAYADVLADPGVDAVALTVRCREQGGLAAQALEAGKHVHAEVPAAHTLEDCWRIVLAAERSGLTYQLAEQTRYWGFVEAWQAMVAAGQLGHITLCEGQYFHYRPEAMFQDPHTGRFYRPHEVAAHPEARPTWSQLMPPIHYLPHELSPMLKVLDDRVVEVVGMSTAAPSYAHPEIKQPDMQVALMKTEQDTILRMAKSSAQPHPERNYHWYQLVGTRGRVEWKRAARDLPRLWLAHAQMHDLAEVDWRYERTDAPPEARGSGHGDADYYVHAAFRDAVLGRRPLQFDVYQAMDTAAPAILAADSIAQGSRPLAVPDFRPGPTRPSGHPPSSS